MDLFSYYRPHSPHEEFDIDTYDLTDESPRSEHPQGIGITLKDHQLTALYRCIEYENRSLKLTEFAGLRARVHEGDYFTTNIGILGDRVGSGKSYVILSLIKANDIRNHDKTMIRSSGMNNVAFYIKNPKSSIKTNMIVVPFNLCTQWENYIKTYRGDLKYKVINRTRIVTDMMDKVLDTINDYDIILITSTFYNKFCEVSRRENVKFQRVFYDEADNLNINSCGTIDANFFWFVTASFGNLIYPKGFAKQDRALNRYIWCADGIRATGFVKNIFQDIYSTIPRSMMKALIVKNSEAYVQRSIELPPMNSYVIRCKTPQSIMVLNGIVDKNIIACLNAGDIQRAIQYMNPNQKMTEENIVQATVEKYTKQVANIEIRLSIIDQLSFDDPAERQREKQALETRKNELERSIQTIKERIVSANMCYICYEEHSTKTVVTCCQNSFCFRCINIWLSKKAVCPMCKAKLTSDQLYVLSDEVAPPKEVVNYTTQAHGGVDGFCDKYEKAQNLETLMAAKKDGKVLIFSCYESSFDTIIPVLDKLKVRYDFLKGNGGHINNIMESYKTGNVNVLLVNTRYYGSGFNMENTTDLIMFHKFDTEVEKQVVGRAQRFGRTQPLNVWYLLHENE